jgi:hypothetical protein
VARKEITGSRGDGDNEVRLCAEQKINCRPCSLEGFPVSCQDVKARGLRHTMPKSYNTILLGTITLATIR